MVTPENPLALTSGTRAFQPIGATDSDSAPPWRHRLLGIELHFASLAAPASVVVQVWRDTAHDYSWLSELASVTIERGLTDPTVGTARFDLGDQDVYHEGVDDLSEAATHDKRAERTMGKEVALHAGITVTGDNVTLTRLIYIFDA
jgi:hypothetical protein